MTGLIVSSIAGNRLLAPLLHHGAFKHQAKHFFYAAGWKKFEPLWNLIIRARQLTRVTPLLEGVLSRESRGTERQLIQKSFPILPSEPIDGG